VVSLISPTGKTKILAPVRANVGIEVEYRRRLDALIEDMHRSLLWWIGAAYKRNEPEIARLAADAGLFPERMAQEWHKNPAVAADDAPASALLTVIRALSRRWQSKFDQAAADLGNWFATTTLQRSDATLKHILRQSGFSVRFRMTRAANDAYRAVIGENVGLIRSIASQHLTQVEGLVVRSVQAGRDLGPLADELERQFGVTRRRAAHIALDQNNKATAVISRVRQQEIGITEAIWLHSHGGREQRPSHVRAGRERQSYKIADGWYDPAEGKRIWPGELVNCRCVSRPVLPGMR